MIKKNTPRRRSIIPCRCGASKNKPFCDGTHGGIGFDGTETASRKSYLEKSEIFEGPDLKLTDAHEFCDHSRFCMGSGGIWNLIKKSGAPEARQTAIKEAMISPSSLVLWDKKSVKSSEKEFEPSWFWHTTNKKVAKVQSGFDAVFLLNQLMAACMNPETG